MSSRGVAWIVAVAALVAAPVASADPGPALTVDAGAGQHPISPYIYGWNYAPADFAQQVDLPVDRRGGNSADTLNWQTGFENHSQDYFFENIPEAPDGQPQRAYTDQIDADRAAHAKTLIDLPMLGYIPKPSSSPVHPYDCSFPKTVFDENTQFSFDPYDTNCGDGRKKADKTQWVTNAPQLGTAIADTPDNEGAWIDHLKSLYNDAANGGVAFYELGNEPGLWNDTHHDWHPAPVSYQELWDKSLALAQAVKAHDPTAAVLAFSEWGWPNYFCSAYDLANSAGCDPLSADRINHGGTELAAWLLQQFKAWADAHGGQRLIDYFDLHYYRQDDGTPGFEPTRSLWDPTYTDPSWVGDKIRLLPRMHDWVDQNYPGTKISLSEYDMSFGDTTVDNLVEADTLGIFARERLDLATLFRLKDPDHYEDAFRLFRNYDGQHSEFGDTYVSSQSADQGQLAVYGARRSSDGALTLAVVNKSTSDLTSSVGLAGFAPGGPAQVFSWSGVAGGIKRIADQPVDASGFNATFPARSMTMVVVPAAGAPLQTGTGNPPPPVGSTTTPPTPTTGSSAPRCVVPRLKGLTLAKAKTKLRKAHCRLGKVARKKSKSRARRVIAQTPKPKKRLKAGTKVNVVLSRGR